MPSDCRCANIVPVHKSGLKDRIIKYRPISLLCTPSKSVVGIMYTSTINHLNDKHLFTSSEQGFRKRCSWETGLVEFYHDIASSYSQGNQIDCAFLDFQKASDMVSHGLRLHKLMALNI